MHIRTLFCAVLTLAVVVCAVLALGQSNAQNPAAPPKTLPPEILNPPAPAKMRPMDIVSATAVGEGVKKKPAPIDRFRNYESLDERTRQIVFMAQRGMEWLSRDGIHLANGRFVAGINPALGGPLEETDFIRQGTGACALARSARLTGDEKFYVRASEAILALLAETTVDASAPTVRKPSMPAAACNRVGSASILAITIFEMPDPPPQMLAWGEELCGFLRGNVRTDGSVQSSEPGDTVDSRETVTFQGMALAAIATSCRNKPEKWKLEALARGYAYYRKAFREAPHPAAIPWLATAFTDAFLQTKDQAYADFVFEMVDWLRRLQYEANDARQPIAWSGGFPEVRDGKIVQAPPTIAAAMYATAFADAMRAVRGMGRPDTARYDGYRLALNRLMQFLGTLQYTQDNTQHFVDHFRPYLMGAFHGSANAGEIQTDQTAMAVSALAQYLIVGADR